jgi:hypothetical protein
VPASAKSTSRPTSPVRSDCVPSNESSSSSAWRCCSSFLLSSRPLRIAASCFLSNFAGRATRVGFAGGLEATRLDADELDRTVGLDTARAGDFAEDFAALLAEVFAGVFFGVAFFAADLAGAFFGVGFLAVALAGVFLEAVFFAACLDAALFAAVFFAGGFLAALFGDAVFGVDGFLAAVMGAGR